MRLVVRLALVALALLLIPACQTGDEVVDPALNAVATRTPTPVPTPRPSLLGTVYSLRPQVVAYLADTDDLARTEQESAFGRALRESGAPCMDETVRPLGAPLYIAQMSLVRFPIASFGPWLAAAAEFPEAEMDAVIRTTLRDTLALLPSGPVVDVCVLPTPAEEAVGGVMIYRWDSPNAHAEQPASATALSGEVLLVTCTGSACLDDLPVWTVFAYGVAAQLEAADQTLLDHVLGDTLVVNGRAALFAEQVYPDRVMPWADALTPEREKRYWDRIRPLAFASKLTDQMLLDRDYNADVVFGYLGDPGYPAWAGLTVGAHMVESYWTRHNMLSWAELFAVPPEEILQHSGYAPR